MNRLMRAIVFGAWVAAQMFGAPPAFEAAFVKINADPGCCVTTQFSADSVIFRKTDLARALMAAYGVRDFQILGPGWLGVGTSGNPGDTVFVYDIVAKAAGPVSNSQLRLMLRTLLTERFHLVLHWEQKEIAVTALLAARSGPKLHESDPGTEVDATFLGFDNVRLQQVRASDGGLRAIFTHAPLAVMAASLSAQIFGPSNTSDVVVDRTGIPGRFDFALPENPRSASGDPRTADDKLAFYKTTIQEELGLTLESRKAPVTDFLVIDHADKAPAAN